MARKAYQYMEITFPADIVAEHGAPIGALKSLLDEYIAETDDKAGKICRDFVFGESKTYQWKENTGAFSIEFNNERNRQTYFKTREAYSAWLETKGVTTTHSVSHDVPFAVAETLSSEYDGDSYNSKSKEYIFYILPEERGFLSEE
jgi:hypothetical protein